MALAGGIAPASVTALLGRARAVERQRSGGSGATVDRVLLAKGEVLFVKAGEGAAARAIADEALRLQWLQGRVPVAAIRQFSVEGERCWLVTDGVPGRPAGAWLSDDGESVRRVAAGMAVFLRSLHALAAAECPFDASVAARLPDARRRVANGLIDEDDFDPDHRGWSAAAVLAEVERLAACADGRVVTHGDFTLGNVLMDERGQVTGCVDVGQLGLADPYQDVAIAWRDLGGFGTQAQERFLRALGIQTPDADRMLLHRCLDELF